MAHFSPFPGDDREQGVRFRRYLIAAGTSLTVGLLLDVCVLAGVLAPRPFLIAALSSYPSPRSTSCSGQV